MKLTEEQFLQQVLELAKIYGWKSAHFRPAWTQKGYRTACQGDAKGFPDLVLLREDRLIFAELKSDTGKLTPEQQDWIDLLKASQKEGLMIEVYVWKPKDWDEIIEVLK